MTNKEKLMERLYADYDSLIENLKELPTEKVIDRAYEIVLKEDICACVEDIEMTPNEIKALLSKKDPLSSLYHEWMKSDCSYMEDLREVLYCATSKIAHDWNKERRNDTR